MVQQWPLGRAVNYCEYNALYTGVVCVVRVESYRTFSSPTPGPNSRTSDTPGSSLTVIPFFPSSFTIDATSEKMRNTRTTTSSRRHRSSSDSFVLLREHVG